MNKIPVALIYSRVLIGGVIPLLAFFDNSYTYIFIAILVIIGLITDVFDGIIARKLNVSSERLRILDSNVDQFFWISVILTIFYIRFSIVKSLLLWILVLVLLEILAYVISYFKFKRTIATHSLLAKFWTLTLLVFLLELLLNNTSQTFSFCFGVGVISRVEIIGIIIRLKKWVTDVPSIWVVDKINKGLPIKKSSWFNS